MEDNLLYGSDTPYRKQFSLYRRWPADYSSGVPQKGEALADQPGKKLPKYSQFAFFGRFYVILGYFIRIHAHEGFRSPFCDNSEW